MSLEREPRAFERRAAQTLADPTTLGALDFGTGLAVQKRLAAWNDLEALRETASRIRSATIAELPRHLETFADAVAARGRHVHWAATGRVRSALRARPA